MAILKPSPATKQKPIIVLYGKGGIGKDTFAAGFPSPLVIDIEDGAGYVTDSRIVPTSWEDTLAKVDAFDTNKYATLVLSGLDVLEALLHRHIVATDPKGAKTMVTAAGGYANAFKVADEMWAELQDKLRKVRASGKYVVCVCHEHVYSYNDPMLEPYDRYRLKLYDGSKASASRLWFDFADIVGFCKPRIYNKGENRAFMDEGSTYLYTQGRASFDAKSRLPLPAEMELNAAKFLAALERGPLGKEELYKELLDLGAKIKDQGTQAKVKQRAEEYKNSVPDLSNLVEQVKIILTKEQ